MDKLDETCAICGNPMGTDVGITFIMMNRSVCACDACKPKVDAALDVVRETAISATRKAIKKKAPVFFKAVSMFVDRLREREEENGQ